MPQVSLENTESIVLELEVADAGSRAAAGVVDLGILLAVFLAGLLLVSVLASFDPTGAAAFVQGFIVLGALLVFVLYHVVLHTLRRGQTVGKSLFGLRVVSDDGQPATLQQIVLRGLVWILDVFVLVPLPLGLIVIATSAKRQRLGDLAARTLVVRDQPRVSISEPWAGESWSALSARELALDARDAQRFDARDVSFLRAVIARRGLVPRARNRLLERVAQSYLARLERPGLRPTRDALKELYLFLREHKARAVSGSTSQTFEPGSSVQGAEGAFSLPWVGASWTKEPDSTARSHSGGRRRPR